MSNNITNIIDAIYLPEVKQNFFSKLLFGNKPTPLETLLLEIGTYHNEKPSTAYNGTFICENGKGDIGYYDEKKKTFKSRNEPEEIDGFPEGFNFRMEPAYLEFPDFNKVLPQPENIFLGDLGSKEIQQCKEEGRPTWLDWNIKNWGTKCDGYNFNQINEKCFSFQTANSSPDPIFKGISLIYPSIIFEISFADEDLGYNLGRYKIRNGDAFDFNYPAGGSKEAYELLFEIKPEVKDYFKFVNGNYIYKEE